MDSEAEQVTLVRYYVANAAWLACIAIHTVIPAKAGTYAAWIPAFALGHAHM
jgi:hypothetical protein